MSKLEMLITELCSDGVAYKPLSEIGEFVRGNGLQRKDFTENGVGCIHYGQIYTYYGLFADKTKSFVSPQLAKTLKKVHTGDLIIASTSENVEDVCKTVAWLGSDEIVTGGHATIFKHEQNPKYMAYFFTTQAFFSEKCKYARGTKVIEISAKDLAKIRVPVPPLPIQNEIVCILDNFTGLTAELTARKKQYEYYRNTLLTFGDDMLEVPLGEICSIGAGGTPQRGNSDYWENGSIKWLGSTVCKNEKFISEITDYITALGLKNSSARVLKRGTTLIAMVGATIGKVAFLDFEAATNQNVAALYPLDENILDSSYLFYASQTLFPQFIALSNGGKLAIANLSFIRDLRIPLPSITEQQRIAAILDRFDTLTANLTSGLPAEISARRKQYEYYRDKLLTFKEIP